MNDHGLDLEFGIFPTPDADKADLILELAQLADVGGLDLVTVQDHPYQARHLDAMTLLSVIAARTTAVTVAPNVANLPLRHPLVLARSVASLDILTGGRAALGLGTGAFWDAIEAAGVSRLTGKESVDALIEGIAIIRGVWGSGSVTVDGQHHHVKGIHAGPAPTRPIPLWLGAYKPRMLRVTGELADGWLPSMGYADPNQLAEMNERIDEAAAKAGRAPADIRRMYNIVGRFGTSADFLRGTANDWIEQLAGLVLDEQMSTFILGTDDADTVRRFAAEVAPGVRELVERERALPTGRPTPETVDHQTPAVNQDQQPLTVTPTPDDGVRLSGQRRWDESTRPTYPVPDSFSYTASQQAHPQHLVDIHDGLRAELTQLRDVIGQVRRGQLTVGSARSVINTMTMRQNNWTLGAYCESYCRIVTGHHTLEDQSVFRHLRVADPDAVPVLDRLHAEHEVIHQVLDEVDQRLVELVQAGTERVPAASALDALEESIDVLSDTLLSHLSYEERELLHPLARHGLN